LVVTTNESHKRIAIERGGVPPGEVYVVRSGPDLGRFTLHPPDPAWRDGKRHLLVYLGEICKQDGVDHLIRALRLLTDEFGLDDFHCVFVGGGPHQPVIRAYAAELGVADRCTFTGRVSDDELCHILSSADVGIDPDPKTAWSDKSTMNKIMEYMFFGLPIVAYDLAEHRISAGPAALYVKPNSERDLAAGIVELLDDAVRRREMGRAASERVRTMLAWEHSAPVLLAAYDCLWPTDASTRAPLRRRLIRAQRTATRRSTAWAATPTARRVRIRCGVPARGAGRQPSGQYRSATSAGADG
jgi:glycosyltransferase involved in cell wall biosynthesis